MRRSNARTPAVDSNLCNGEETTPNMDSIKLPFRPNHTHRSTNLFSFHRNPKNQNSKSEFLLYLSISLFLVLFSYIFFCNFITSHRNSVKRKFGVVIDGGSTGTRIHVFRYEVRNGVPEFDFGEKGLVSMRVNPGLSAFASNPEGAGDSLGELVEFAKTSVPKDHWKDTEIRLMATAGLRLVQVQVQQRILESCRGVLRLSGFRFNDDWASVISGPDEGIYAWVVANYALGTLGGDPQLTTGIIELGGASAQVTFVTGEPIPPEFSHTVKYWNSTYNLYSHSFLNFGQNVAFDLLKESLATRVTALAAESLPRAKPVDPCTPKGYVDGSQSWKFSPSSLAEKNRYVSTLHPGGNFSDCRFASLMLLQKDKDKCSYERCHIGSTFIPRLQGKFLATENFFHTFKFFGLAPRAFLSDLVVAGQQFCEEEWSMLKRKYHSLDEEDLLQYCFSSAYIVALLHDSLGIALNDERIGYANQVQNIPLDWALGAFILQTAADSKMEHWSWISTVIEDSSSTLLALIGISAILIFTAWYMSKWRKPQVKTIYDLKKGKYIVTRVSRF